MKRHSRYNRGFTLIELLVVIAIISLLSSVVLASTNNARQKSQGTAVIQEFNQLKNALTLYANDNNGNYPASLNALVTGGYISSLSPLGTSTTVTLTYLVPGSSIYCGKAPTVSPVVMVAVNSSYIDAPSLPDMTMLGLDLGPYYHCFQTN